MVEKKSQKQIKQHHENCEKSIYIVFTVNHQCLPIWLNLSCNSKPASTWSKERDVLQFSELLTTEPNCSRQDRIAAEHKAAPLDRSLQPQDLRTSEFPLLACGHQALSSDVRHKTARLIVWHQTARTLMKKTPNWCSNFTDFQSFFLRMRWKLSAYQASLLFLHVEFWFTPFPWKSHIPTWATVIEQM